MFVYLSVASAWLGLLRSRIRQSVGDERGSQVLEYVLMAGGGVLLCVIAYAALKSFVFDSGNNLRNRAGDLK